MSYQKFFSHVHRNINKFTKTDYLINDFFKKNIELLHSMDTASISETLGVSKSAISRYCQKIDYEGFEELKYELKNNSAKYSYEEDNVLDSLIKEYQLLLNRFENLIDSKNLKATIDLIKSSKFINLIGIGSSGIIADYLSYRLRRYGFKSMSFKDIDEILIQSLISPNDEIFIYISSTGKTPVIIQSLENNKNIGSKAILLSMLSESPSSNLADITLLFPSYLDLEYHSDVPLFFLTDYLVANIINTNENLYIKKYNETLKIINRGKEID